MNPEVQTKINQLKDSKSEQDRKECIPLLQQHLKENPTDAVVMDKWQREQSTATNGASKTADSQSGDAP